MTVEETATTTDQILDSNDPSLFDVRSKAAGPQGSLPVTPEMLIERPTGDLFGWSMNAGMGWDISTLGRKEFLILSTHGGIRAADGTPIALGYHTGHWEVGLLMEAAARELKARGAIPFAAYCTDPCDGRTQGTNGMFDSLPYRNDAATVFGRLIRSLPTCKGVLGVATCDKGLPAMMMALAGAHNLPCVLVPGGVTLQAEDSEDAGKIQSAGARFARGQMTLQEAADALCRACATPGGGCQFLGTAATSQVVGEALGMSLPHSALSPSGHPIWTDMAVRSARAAIEMEKQGTAMRHVLTAASVRNALVVHAACGGSTNLILHLPAIAYAAGLQRPTVDDWARVNRQTPRLVDSLPNGPKGHPTVQVFLAGGVPELMLHLRRMGLLETDALTVSGHKLGAVLDWWEQSERRVALRKLLKERDGVDPDDVIMDADGARRRGLTSTVTFPKGNLAPGGAVIKSTAIDPSMVDASGVYRHVGPARVFLTERAAIKAIKGGEIRRRCASADVPRSDGHGHGGNFRDHGRAEVSGFRQACGGADGRAFQRGFDWRVHRAHHAGGSRRGPIGKLREGDLIEIVIDRVKLEGTVNLLAGDAELAARPLRDDLAADPDLPPQTRLWAALQNASGGTWGGCVFAVDDIVKRLA